MKKRVFVGVILALAAALALGALAGCSDAGKQAAIDAYKQSTEAMSGQRNVKLDANYDLSVKAQGMTMKMDGDMKMHYAIPEDIAKVLESQFAVDMTINVDAVVEKINMGLGAYYKDHTLYYHAEMNGLDEAIEPIKAYIKLPSELDSSLEKALSQLDLDELRATMEEQFPKFESYITAGSFNNGHLEMSIDTMRLIKDSITAAGRQSGEDFEEVLGSVSELQKSVKSCDTRFTADLNDDMTIKAYKITIDMVLDSSAMGGGVNGDVEVSMVIDCPNISLDPKQKVEFPNFEGYVDQTDQLGELFSSLPNLS